MKWLPLLAATACALASCGHERRRADESPRQLAGPRQNTEAAADADLPPEAMAPEAARPNAGALSFLLITVDTLRPDLGFMGYERPVSPRLDQLASRSVVYEHAYSISTYTGFSIPPMLASRYPSEMPRTDRHEVKYLAQNVLLAERLRAAGYRTAGAASHFLFAPPLGWIDGFERFVSVPSEGTAPPDASLDWYHSSRPIAEAAIKLLADPEITADRFFIWIHFVDPHSVYLEHKGFSNFGRDPRGLYDGEVAYTDFHIGRVLDALEASPAAGRTAVILTADHGEAFGEHGEFRHGRHLGRDRAYSSRRIRPRARAQEDRAADQRGRDRADHPRPGQDRRGYRGAGAQLRPRALWIGSSRAAHPHRPTEESLLSAKARLHHGRFQAPLPARGGELSSLRPLQRSR